MALSPAHFSASQYFTRSRRTMHCFSTSCAMCTADSVTVVIFLSYSHLHIPASCTLHRPQTLMCCFVFSIAFFDFLGVTRVTELLLLVVDRQQKINDGRLRLFASVQYDREDTGRALNFFVGSSCVPSPTAEGSCLSAQPSPSRPDINFSSSLWDSKNGNFLEMPTSATVSAGDLPGGDPLLTCLGLSWRTPITAVPRRFSSQSHINGSVQVGLIVVHYPVVVARGFSLLRTLSKVLIILTTPVEVKSHSF